MIISVICVVFPHLDRLIAATLFYVQIIINYFVLSCRFPYIYLALDV